MPNSQHVNAQMQWNAPEAGGRAVCKQLLVRAAANVSATLNGLWPARETAHLGILMYHRVTEPIRGLERPSINVSPMMFRRQIEGLLDRGYTFLPLQEALKISQSGEAFEPKSVVLTFDDGFQSVYNNALPVLQELNVPATVFLSTAFLDSSQPMPFDHWGLANRTLAPSESFQCMTTEQCKSMLATGLIELGAHTHTHQDFRGRPDEFALDLRKNLTVLSNEFGVESPSFAFPYGTPRLGFSGTDLIEQAKECGVQCGLTTEASRVSSSQESFTWGRFNVFPWDDGATLTARLNGWYGWAPRQRDRCVGIVRSLLGKPANEVDAASVGEVQDALVPAATTSSLSEVEKIHIIVPTFNRAHWIGDGLKTLDEQTSDGAFEFDIIVVDNNSTDETEQVVRELAAQSKSTIQYFRQMLPGDAPTRNCGVNAGDGQWFAFFDDDQLAEPDWLSELYRAARAANAHVVGGPVHLDLPQSELQRIGPLCRRALREISYYSTLQPYINNDLPGTGNALVRREVFRAIGDFDESMTSGGSDSDFFLRAREGGFRLWYTPTAVIRHRISANRLTPEYLRWDALSGGAGHAAHFDCLKRGKTVMLANCIMRIAQAGLWHFPMSLLASWQGDEGQMLGRRTRIWRTEGYARKTLAVLAPKVFAQKAFFESLEFRKGREVGVDQAESNDSSGSPDCDVDESVSAV